MSEENENKKSFFEKLKEDKKYRFEFIIGIWSGLVSVVLLVAVVFVARAFIMGTNTVDSEDEVAMDDQPVVVTEQAIEPE